ncbi:hypothetical protein [Lacisediminimonas profundi]|uniref:hypothetical protein n=1 Tax=Lacisediminimonas profundi TaxID=2603856 RepID=UPI00124B9920|nr:hypothetical protein [Lacisediminimonas profundi]
MDGDLSLSQLERIKRAYRLMSVARSYLDGIADIVDDNERKKQFVARLQRGNLSDAALAVHLKAYRESHNGAELPQEDPRRHGSSALPGQVAREIANGHSLLLHMPTDPRTGFCASILNSKDSGEIIVVIRDPELTPTMSDSGHDQDPDGADLAHLVRNGAAYGQIESAQDMLDHAFETGIIPPGSRLALVAGSMAGNVALTLKKMNPERFSEAPEAHILVNPTGLGMPHWHESFYLAGTNLGETETYREILQVYRDLKAAPALATPKLAIFPDDGELIQHFNAARDAPPIGPADSVYGSCRDRFAAAFIRSWYGIDLPPRPAGSNSPRTYHDPSVLSVIQMAGDEPDGFWLAALGYQPSQRVCIPIEWQPGFRIGGLKIDYGNKHCYSLGAKSVEILIAYKKADPALTIETIGRIMQVAGSSHADRIGEAGAPGAGGDVLSDMIDYLRDAVAGDTLSAPTPCTESLNDFARYDNKGQFHRDAMSLQRKLSRFTNGHVIPLIDMNEETILREAARNDPTGEALRFALMRNSPVAFIADEYRPPQWAGTTALIGADASPSFPDARLRQLIQATTDRLLNGADKRTPASEQYRAARQHAASSPTAATSSPSGTGAPRKISTRTSRNAEGAPILIRTVTHANGDQTITILDVDNRPLQRTEVRGSTSGDRTTTVFDQAGLLVYQSVLETSPVDNCRVETTQHADGRTVQTVANAQGSPVARIETAPVASGITRTTRYYKSQTTVRLIMDKDGKLIERTVTIDSPDEPAAVNVFDSKAVLLGQGEKVVHEDGSTSETIQYRDGRIMRVNTDQDGQITSRANIEPGADGAWVEWVSTSDGSLLRLTYDASRKLQGRQEIEPDSPDFKRHHRDPFGPY